MTAINIPLALQKRIRYQDYARNGKLVDARFGAALAQAANQSVYCRGKELFRWYGGLIALGGNGNVSYVPASNGTRARWRFAGHTSKRVSKVRAELLIAEAAASTFRCGTTVTLNDITGGITYGTASAFYGASLTGGTDVLSSWGVCVVDFDVPGDTDVYGVVQDFNGGRVVSGTIYELMLPGDDANGYVAGNYVATGPIQDIDREAVSTLARDHWKKGAAQSWNWCVNVDATPRTTTSATDKNLIDTSVTTVTTSSPGATLDFVNKAKFSSSTAVAVKMAVYGSVLSGTNGTVKLKNSSGTVVASVTGFSTTPGWLTTTFTLPNTKGKYDIMFSTAASTLSVGAVSIFEIE